MAGWASISQVKEKNSNRDPAEELYFPTLEEKEE